MNKNKSPLFLLILTSLASVSLAKEMHPMHLETVSDQVIAQQRSNLADNTTGKGYGPQSPRDIDSAEGRNLVRFGEAPPYAQMNLCNIHFHRNAEHKGGEFTQYAGNGDGQGNMGGYQYAGQLTSQERLPLKEAVCSSEHGGLSPGDTIEVHYVYSSAQIHPGPSLGACMNEAITNPQLRVEAQVFVLVNDAKAKNFSELTRVERVNDVYQAVNIPNDTGVPVNYAGSTTGATYNEKASPFQVSWSVRPNVAKVNIESVGEWCKGNVFQENHAHGVRNLVINPDLLSPIGAK